MWKYIIWLTDMQENKIELRNRVLSFLLIGGLVLAVVGLFYTLESLTNIMPLQLDSLSLGQEERPQDTGKIIIKAWLSELDRWRPDQRVIIDLPILISKGEPPTYNETYYTNSDGSVEIRLPSGDYMAKIQDPRFNLSAEFKVEKGNATRLSIIVNRTSYRASYYELFDRDYSGLLKTWEMLHMAIPASELTTNFVDNVFLNVLRTSAISGENLVPDSEEIDAKILDDDFRNESLWLILQPSREFSTENISSLYLVSYQPSYEVRIGAT